MKPIPPNLNNDDFPSVPRELLRGLARFAGDVCGVLAGGLTVGDNLDAYKATVVVDEKQTMPLRVKNKLSGARVPTGVLLLNAVDLTAAGQPSVSLGNPGWSVTSDQILINAVSGFTPGHSYRLTVLVVA